MIQNQPMDPLVSIIVPTYKRPDMLGRALDSLVGQTYGNIEIIVISDNDPDSGYAAETNHVMEGYLEDPRVRFMTTSGTRHPAYTRNMSPRCCTGRTTAANSSTCTRRYRSRFGNSGAIV